MKTFEIENFSLVNQCYMCLDEVTVRKWLSVKFYWLGYSTCFVFVGIQIDQVPTCVDCSSSSLCFQYQRVVAVVEISCCLPCLVCLYVINN